MRLRDFLTRITNQQLLGRVRAPARDEQHIMAVAKLMDQIVNQFRELLLCIIMARIIFSINTLNY